MLSIGRRMKVSGIWLARNRLLDVLLTVKEIFFETGTEDRSMFLNKCYFIGRILSRLLTHTHLPGLSSLDQMHLLALADTVSTCDADFTERLTNNARVDVVQGGQEVMPGRCIPIIHQKFIHLILTKETISDRLLYDMLTKLPLRQIFFGFCYWYKCSVF